MDRRIGFTGGEIGITNTELDLMPNSNRDGMQALATALTDGVDAILTGVNAIITPGVSVSVSAGWVLLDGELLEVDAGTVPRTAGTNLYRFQKVSTTNLAAYNRSYRDGTTHNVAEINRAVPVNVASIGGSDLPVDGTEIAELLKTQIQVQSNWTETDTSDPAFIRNKPILIDVRNLGSVAGIDPGGSGSPIGTGDISGVSPGSIDGNETRFTVTMANPMDNLNYYLRISTETVSGNIKDNGQIREPVWRKVSTTQFILSYGELVSRVQSLRCHIEAIQLTTTTGGLP